MRDALRFLRKALYALLCTALCAHGYAASDAPDKLAPQSLFPQSRQEPSRKNGSGFTAPSPGMIAVSRRGFRSVFTGSDKELTQKANDRTFLPDPIADKNTKIVKKVGKEEITFYKHIPQRRRDPMWFFWKKDKKIAATYYGLELAAPIVKPVSGQIIISGRALSKICVGRPEEIAKIIAERLPPMSYGKSKFPVEVDGKKFFFTKTWAGINRKWSSEEEYRDEAVAYLGLRLKESSADRIERLGLAKITALLGYSAERALKDPSNLRVFQGLLDLERKKPMDKKQAIALMKELRVGTSRLDTSQATKLARYAFPSERAKIVTAICNFEIEGDKVFLTSQAVRLAISRDPAAAVEQVMKILKIPGPDGIPLLKPYQAVALALDSDPVKAEEKAVFLLGLSDAAGDLLLTPTEAIRWATTDSVTDILEHILKTNGRLPDMEKDDPEEWRDLMAFRGFLRVLKQEDVSRLMRLFLGPEEEEKFNALVVHASSEEDRIFRNLSQYDENALIAARRDNAAEYESLIWQAGQLGFSFRESLRLRVRDLLYHWHEGMIVKSPVEDLAQLYRYLLLKAAGRYSPYTLWVKGEKRMGRFDTYLFTNLRFAPAMLAGVDCPPEIRKIVGKIFGLRASYHWEHKALLTDADIEEHLGKMGIARGAVTAAFNYLKTMSFEDPHLPRDVPYAEMEAFSESEMLAGPAFQQKEFEFPGISLERQRGWKTAKGRGGFSLEQTIRMRSMAASSL